ncbi:MAG: hypothetical protein AAFT19_05010 [Pseudomonadota bacterium]
MTRVAALAALVALYAGSTSAAPLCDGKSMGFAGLLAKCNKGDEIELTLAAGKPLAEGAIVLESGAYYEMMITSDGSQELALTGPEFFRAVWMDEIVINDLEIRPMAIDSFEFDDAGTIEFSFIAIKPGRYEMKIPGSTGESQRVDIQIK